MNIKRTTAILATAVAAASTTIVGGVASPAYASGFASCTAPYWHSPVSYRKCTTGSVSANSKRQISIYVSACKGSPWKAWDIGTGVTIARGTASKSSFKVSGLVGNYRAQLTDACWKDYISINGN